MNLTDSFFNKVERKTNVKKSSILNLAKKLQGDNMKNEDNLREVIRELSEMTGKNVSKEQEDKIISTVINDKIPNNLDKMI
ncbi:MAG: stage VI sporulation protein F [Bacilli bacterium]|nr:stage VI sporulation protein F [Bacilli bacterium]